MKGLVLCAVFLVLGGNQSFGVNVNLDFLNDPDFPGNAGWNAKLNQQIADTVNNPDFPGNAGWNAKLDQQIKDTMNSAMNSANTGSSGSNVVAPTVTGSRPPRPMREPRPPRPMRPNVVRPRPPRPMKPEVVRPIPSILPDNENNIISNPVIESTGSSNSMQNMENTNVGNDYVTSTAPTLNRPTPVPAVPMKPSFNIQGPNLQNMRLPHAPPNFPFPPDCSEVADPGYKFRDPLQINYGDQKPEIRHRSFLCTDPEYGQDSFYMQMTEARNPNGSGSSRIAAYYDKTGNSIDYSRKMVFLPLGEKLPDMPRNDYLKMDVTF
ncbi:hypothetical protein LSTR_LSTR003025 [Laodelphax striatellus]|uniref:Uncharacterized protein n=1 Tax=Laodelphax striatellus TaxID=195883 RepID=A0A482XU63_LAOST|nr:hypothetical protein LSTR_LSTR003025 [Laodelphax striatellus]